jgi:hypothetical protein
MGDESCCAEQKIHGQGREREKRSSIRTQADELFEEEEWATIPEAMIVSEAHAEVPCLIPGRWNRQEVAGHPNDVANRTKDYQRDKEPDSPVGTEISPEALAQH